MPVEKSESTAQVRSVGIVGGGSAGYIAALYLKRKFPELEITVIESSKIPVVGVGEATTQPMLHFLHGLMGFPVREFFQQAKPTLKLGIKFVWGVPERDHFNSPFGYTDLVNTFACTGDMNQASLTSMLMEANRVPFIRKDEKVMPTYLGNMAYHIDNRNFLRYMRGKLDVLGCNHLDREVREVRLRPDGSGVDCLVTDDDEERRFDLYLDCSGFRSLLLEKALGAEWVSYRSSLWTDRAVVGVRPNGEEIEPYTTATTMKSGWLWNTPMQDESHLGYVFSSDYLSDEEALEELGQHCATVQKARVIRFRSGRHSQCWLGNVVAVGNSFAFIEPLESTGIHMILRHLKSLSKVISSGITEQAVSRFNHRMNERWDSLRWFIALHFRHNGRLDTPFWRACRAESDTSGVREYEEYFRCHGPLFVNPEHPLAQNFMADKVFGLFMYDTHLTGCGLNPDSPLQPNRERENDFLLRNALDRNTVRRALGHREALAWIEENDFDRQDRWRVSTV